MKWFKHYCNSLSDPFIQELLDEFKGNGYLAWFGLIELIGEDNGHNLTGKLEVKPSFLRRKFHISASKLEVMYNFCCTKGKLRFKVSEVYWYFEMPKIAEIKDNHTSNLQVTSKQPSLEKEKSKKKIKNKSKREIGKSAKHIYGEFKKVRLTDDQYKKLIKDLTMVRVKDFIKRLDEYLENNPKKSYANHNLTIRNWEKSDKENNGQGSGRHSDIGGVKPPAGKYDHLV